MSKKSAATQPAPCVPMLAVTGEVQVSEAFFQRIDERIRESVLSAMADTLEQVQSQLNASAPPRSENLSGGGLELPPGETERAKNAKSGSLGLKLNEGQGLIDGKMLAVFLDISYRTFYRLVDERALPEPISLGGRTKRWSVEEILAWVMSGCPRAEHWKRRKVEAIRDYRALSSPKDQRRG